MKVSETIKKCFNEESRTNILSTSSKSGEINIAMFGSLILIDDSTVAMMLGDNKTYANLKENPNAACLLIMPGKTGIQTEGCRLYLKVKTIEDSGDKFDSLKAKVKVKIGDAAEMLKHLIVFNIINARPILDMGQGI